MRAPRSPSQPTSPSRFRPVAGEHQALQLALFLAIGVLLSEALPEDESPIKPDSYDARWAWLRRRLAPLAAGSPAVEQVRRLLDDRAVTAAWHDAPGLTRTLRTMSTAAHRLGRDAPPHAGARGSRRCGKSRTSSDVVR